ncbi:hypothetical protein OH76DRAFT_1554390 [Lentinus brumalis]|uniref:Uncharacterized protein n=1 Tax=Lentinus brumalis TaxID=2498619 RepID=A0A371DI85_9APHY|nr:hypothetical protein OH76DRAFT_1554390 [Polyporus brumalis]
MSLYSLGKKISVWWIGAKEPASETPELASSLSTASASPVVVRTTEPLTPSADTSPVHTSHERHASPVAQSTPPVSDTSVSTGTQRAKKGRRQVPRIVWSKFSVVEAYLESRLAEYQHMNTGAREDFFSAVGDSVVEDPKYMDPLSRAKHPVANVRKAIRNFYVNRTQAQKHGCTGKRKANKNDRLDSHRKKRKVAEGPEARTTPTVAENASEDEESVETNLPGHDASANEVIGYAGDPDEAIDVEGERAGKGKPDAGAMEGSLEGRAPLQQLEGSELEGHVMQAVEARLAAAQQQMEERVIHAFETRFERNVLPALHSRIDIHVREHVLPRIEARLLKDVELRVFKDVSTATPWHQEDTGVEA